MKIALCISLLIHLGCHCQEDSVIKLKAQEMFIDNFGEIGDYLNYSLSPISRIRNFMFRGFRSKIVLKAENRFELYFTYGDDNWHQDGFWYDVDLNIFENSTYYFVNQKNIYPTKENNYTGSSKIDYIEISKLEFIDSMTFRSFDSQTVVYKFKTTHFVNDSNKVCMLHFISRDFGLITRQSDTWYCDMKSPASFPPEYTFCPFQDRNHFSILNISNQYIEVEKFGKKVKEERPNWIIRELRTGTPPDSSILNFYNDTVSCNCNYDALFRGYFEYLEQTKPNEGFTKKQIRKIGRKDKRYFRRIERKAKKEEE